MSIIYNNAIVEKRNVLNELRSNNMTIQELRFFSIYLSKINPWDVSTRVVRFPISDFQRIMCFGRLNIAQLKSSTNSLLSKIVNIPTERGGYTAFQLFKECTVDKDDNGEWYVEIDAHDKALPLMFEFKNRYFTYELWNALRLKSPNQVRMYEILKQYEKLGRRELPVQELRELLGIGKNEYSGRTGWSDFKKKVLDSCQQALKETTDICYTYDRGKVGRGGKWLTIIFNIHKNEEYIDQLTLDEFIQEQPKAEIIEADFVEDQIDGQISFDSIAAQLPDQSEEIDEDELRLARYGGDERLAILAEAVNDEFCKEDMEQISFILTRIDIPADSNLTGYDAILYGRQHYLQEKYAALNAEDAKKARKGEKPISDRAAYFKRMLEQEARRED
ncbi:MAG: replication initiation protein [Ruminococcus sp.]|nr:replication initiation protein [Ruminococcus sp.]MCR5021767.1 replication initiation protein [Ruminococcus sp.]